MELRDGRIALRAVLLAAAKEIDPAKIAYWTRVQQSLKTMVDDPVAGQRSLRITSGDDSVEAVTDRIATAIEAINRLGR